jgi:GNAT superfamily N-acetyltransferase
MKRLIRATPGITYQRVPSLPDKLLERYAAEPLIGNDGKKSAQKATVVIAASSSEGIIGFLAGNYFKDTLAFNSFYVAPEYRLAGIGGKLISKGMTMARKEHLHGLSFERLTPITEEILYKLKDALSKSPKVSIEFQYDPGSYAFCDVKFTDRPVSK